MTSVVVNMADDWADFKSSKNGSRSANDDEWADFGGFESASPAANPFGNSVSTNFPWATHGVFPTDAQQSASAGVPATFPAQATVDTVMPFAGSAQSTTLSKQNALTIPNTPPENSISQAPVVSGHELLISPSIENVTRSSPSAFQADSSSQIPPQIALSQGNTPGQHLPELSKGSARLTEARVSDLDQLNKTQQMLKETNLKVVNYENKLQESEKKLTLAEQEKLRLEKSLEEMKRKWNETEELAKGQFLEIQKQKEKYEELQEKHEEQLKGLREAGQESFALIVEEYKELSRSAVAQQQEASEKRLQQVLEEEREKFSVFLSQQNENTKLVVKEEQDKSLLKLQEALEEQKVKHQAELNEAMDVERRRCKEAVEKAVQEERDRAKILVEESLSVQKKNFDIFIEEQKKMFEETLQEQKKEMEKKMELALKEEQERARNAIDEALAEERQNSRNAVDLVKEKTKEEMGKYIKEKGKADEVVRLRRYQSMDLFLQGVKAQLDSLMNNSDMPSSSSQ